MAAAHFQKPDVLFVGGYPLETDVKNGAFMGKNSSLLRKTVHDGDIIAIVTVKKGLEISHIGIAAWHKDGLHMLNASSLYHKVVEDHNLLRTYLSKQTSALGIRIARPL